MKYSAIILAAGSGKRSGLKDNKILLKIHEKRIVDFSIKYFENDVDCSQIILVINRNDFNHFDILKNSKINQVIFGGLTRQKSVYNSLEFIEEEYVLIHDAARPYIPKESVEILKRNLSRYSSLTLGVKVSDTIQRVENSFVNETLDRNQLIATQTPQAFHKSKLIEAHKLALQKNIESTDDTTLLLELLNIPAFFVEGDKKNIKFTNMDDLLFLEVIL